MKTAVEKKLSFATRDVPPFTRASCIGVELAQLQPGTSLRIHIFESTTSNGDEKIVSPYIRETEERTISETIARMKLPLRVRRDGLDILVEATT